MNKIAKKYSLCIILLLILCMFYPKIILFLKFYHFKRYAWEFISDNKNNSLLTIYNPVKIAHLHGYCISNITYNSRITLCLEDGSQKVVVFFENVSAEKMNSFYNKYHPNVIYVIKNEKKITRWEDKFDARCLPFEIELSEN